MSGFAAVARRTVDAAPITRETTDMNAKSGSLSKRRVLALVGLIALVAGAACLAIGWLTDVRAMTGFGTVAAITGAVWLACSRFTADDPLRPADRRYLREFFPAMLAYMLVLLLVWPLERQIQGVAARAAIALLPMLPVIFVVRALLRLVLASDELERRIQLEAISIASLTVGLLTFSAGFLQAAGLLHLEAGLLLVLPALFFVYGVASWWARRRYRAQ